MWQKLYSELANRNFVILTIAMDSRGTNAVRGPIRRAKATHPSLVDEDHLVAELYNMVNVPQAVWIDEKGIIVRPTEVSGAAMTFNVAKMRKLRKIYLDAIRDWVEKGDQSEHAFQASDARDHLPTYTDDIALAHANFHLGRALWDAGNREEGAAFLKRAVDLHPGSWNFFRQMKNLEHILGSGGPDMMKRVRQANKAGREYYPLPDMAGMPGS